MKLLYVSLSYIPSRRASSVHVMRMCAALARAGHEVELLAKPGAEARPEGADDHHFYGVAREFRITKLPRPAWRGGGVVFAASIARALVQQRGRVDLVYSRELIGAVLAAELGLPVVFESHGVPTERANRALMRRLVSHKSLRGLVVISDALRRDLVAERMVPRDAPIAIAHDAADPPGAVDTGRPLHVPPRIGYLGNLYAGRGIELILEVAARMPDLAFELVGGTETDLARWRAHGVPPNVELPGFVPPGQLRARYESFDVLLLPHPRSGVAAATGIDISRWTSPMKMFEYMASGSPIIASDLPVLGEVLHHERNALIARAGDATAWERAIRRLCEDRALARRLAQQAYEDLSCHYTWDARVQTILDSLALTSTPFALGRVS